MHVVIIIIIIIIIITIILMMMMMIINNNFNNFNETFSYELIVYPRYAAMQSDSVLRTAIIRRFLLSSKVQFNWCIRQESSKV